MNVKPRSAGRRGPPLHTDGKPGGALGFDGFYHTVQGNRTHAETIGRPCNCAAVLAVHDQLPFAVDAAQARVSRNHDGVTQARFRRMPMLQCLGPLPSQVQVKRAAVDRVEGMHRRVHGEQGQPILTGPVAQTLFFG